MIQYSIRWRNKLGFIEDALFSANRGCSFFSKRVDKRRQFWYNKFRGFIWGEMAEWFKALVLKTSDVERHRGFESLSLRQIEFIWRSTQEAEGAPLLRE